MRQLKLALNIEGLDPSGIEVYANTIEIGLTGNTKLPNAVSFLPLLVTGKNDLHNAIHAILPSASVIKSKVNYIVKVLVAIKGMVELECAENEEIATSSGFVLKQITLPKPKMFDSVQGKLSGTVELQAPYAGTHAAYIWEMIADPINLNTWAQIKVSNNTTSTVTGLTPGNKYWFRVKAIVKNEEQPYTDPHMVHVV